MKKRIKVIGKFLFIFLLLGCLAIGGFYAFKKFQSHHDATKKFSSRPTLVKAKDGNSISAGHHNLEYLKKKLNKKYPNFYNAIYNTPKRTQVGSDVVIPGQVQTMTYSFKKNGLIKTTTMTPQGITVAGKYILITAYDSTHQSASVIYVLNKKTGHYIKTIQVNGTPHLGGIAYDPVAKNIWITGSQNGQSALMSFTYKELENYKFSKKNPFIKYNYIVALPTIERASAVTYDDNQLFVGFFNKSDKGRIVAYPIPRVGQFKNTITSDQIKAATGTATWASGSGAASMNRQIQGIAVYGDWIILSQSYGSKDSKLYFFPASAINNLDESNADKVVTVPPYLEQIYAYKGQLLMLFESGAKKYAKDSVTVVDRVLSANINALLGS
ncbi:hypothetical protein [Lactobacillus sp.]|uniref:YncE family protein n=1 Tax=Lactobacillus sp. TaxID=1591 RepID=UPI0019856BA6|nr:hypothetical protein [Lactobacillus sp.]MBD5429427.1 hypothetical protein [Lactobacillus sp.]